MHPLSSLLVLSLLQLSTSSVIRRQDPDLQPHPDVARAPGTFSNGHAIIGEPDEVGDALPAIYGPRSVDLPFNRLYHGNMKFFSTGQLNTPDHNTSVWGSAYDNAEQSACGIPDNAFWISKVAIHPYFLKYAGLDRYCMQDVCISFWREDGKSDMMLKVTDICSTDPSDPTHCADPTDIKIDRSKAKIMELYHPDASPPAGDQYPEKVWWFFTKCWADGLPQPAYQNPTNWFANPPLPNNQKHASAAATQQYKNNQVAYAAKGWPTYPDGSYNPKRDSETSPPISDWVPGQEPAWSPIAGGKGFAGKSSSNPSPPLNPSQSSAYANPAPLPSSSNSPSPPSSTPTSSSTSPTASSSLSSTSTTSSGNGYASSNNSPYAFSNATTGSTSMSTISTSSASTTSASTSSTSTSSTSTSTTTPAPNNGYLASTSSSASASTSSSASAPASPEQTGNTTTPSSGKQGPPTTDPEIVLDSGDDGECEA